MSTNKQFAQMTAESYREIIAKGMQGLSAETLLEIAHFVLFVRKRTETPGTLREEMNEFLLRQELKELSRSEEKHIEKEAERLFAE